MKRIALVAIAIGTTPLACGPSPQAVSHMPPPTATPTSLASSQAPSASASVPVATPAPAPVAKLPKGRWEACQEAPSGMVCIPGGKAVIGSNDHTDAEKPRHSVEISTFYIDTHETTNADYAACVKDKACPQLIPAERPFNDPKLPAVPLPWKAAHKYCLWAGKRLPTEAEWEKVARGGEEARIYPWGNDAPSCDKAQFKGCKPDTTLPVGSKPAGAYGVFDMAGNGYEWVQDWASDCFDGCTRACGDACKGLDPTGPCGGGPICTEARGRVLKGGSWYWGPEKTRGSWRRANKMDSGQHRLSVRCASTLARLATWPPTHVSAPPKAPAKPAPPTAAQRKIFRSVPEDTDVFKIPACKRIGDATHDCRDPHSYVITNEPHQYLWAPYLENRGGAYVGIGSAQSYSFIALARSQWAWIFDYDPGVVRVHYILRALIMDNDTPAKMVAGLEKHRLAHADELIRASLKDDIASDRLPESELSAISHSLRIAAPALRIAFRKDMKAAPEQGKFGWLRHPEQYAYIRTLFLQGRILITKGNLLTDVALPNISRAAKQLGVPVRVFYTSNADDQWQLTPTYRKSLAGIPFDDQGIVLRTVIPRHLGAHTPWKWDYTVQDGRDFHRRVQDTNVPWLHWYNQDGRRHKTPKPAPKVIIPDLVTIGLPGSR